MKTILIVDDEPHLRLLYRDTFEEEGYRVVEAEGAEAALAILETEHVDLAILDIRMPGTHGLDLLTHMHSIYPRLPVVLCSGLRSLFRDYAVWNAREQIVGTFEKPASLEALVACVNGALREPPTPASTEAPTPSPVA